jgi:hypothetical protein
MNRELGVFQRRSNTRARPAIESPDENPVAIDIALLSMNCDYGHAPFDQINAQGLIEPCRRDVEFRIVLELEPFECLDRKLLARDRLRNLRCTLLDPATVRCA